MTAKIPEPIQQQSKFYESLLEGLSDAVLAVDAEEKFSYCNGAVQKLLGYSPEEVIGVPALRILPEVELVGGNGGDLWEVLKAKGRYDGRAIVPRRDGERFHAVISVSTVYDDAGREGGWVGTVRDIDQRVRLTEALTITNRFLAASSRIGRFISEGLPLHSLLERFVETLAVDLGLSSVGIYLISGDTAQLQAHWGLVGNVARTVSKVRLNAMEIKAIVQSGRALRLETAFEKNSKVHSLAEQYGFLNGISVPLISKDDLIGYLVMIPEQRYGDLELSLSGSLGVQIALAVRNAELVRNLRESERKYSTVVERANDGIMISQDGVFKFVNKQLADMLGFSVSEMAEMEIVRAMHPEDVPRISERYESRIAGTVPSEIYQGRLQTKHDTILDVEFNACTIRYDDRPASLSFVRDISRRVALQNQVVEQKEMAEFYNDVMTHDINNFCQTMLASVDIIRSELGGEGGELVQDRLVACDRTVKKISEMIDRVREMMHIHTITSDNLIPQDLSAVVNEAIDIARETFPKLRIAIDAQVPKGSFVLAHQLLVLVFLNLLTNSIKHNDNDMPKIEIRVETAHIGEGRPAWRIDVSDNGPGIPEAIRQKVFQRYTRASKSKGKGLGLSIVRALIDKHNGELFMASENENENESDSSQGLTVSVVLPKA
jgi:PAS domain S-box-containing protein